MQTPHLILAPLTDSLRSPVRSQIGEDPARPKLIVLTEIGDTDITWAARDSRGAPSFWFSPGEASELKRYLDRHPDALVRSVSAGDFSPRTIISDDSEGTVADYCDQRFRIDLNRPLTQLADYPLAFAVYPVFDEMA